MRDVLFRNLYCMLTGTAFPHIFREISQVEPVHARLDDQTRMTGFPQDDTGVDRPHEWELSANGKPATRLEFQPGGQHPSAKLQMHIESSVVLLRGQKWGTSPNGCSSVSLVIGRSTTFIAKLAKGMKWRADCHCSFNKLRICRATGGAYLGDRVQLQNIHPVMRAGVRALQRIPAHSSLPECVGEIYAINNEKPEGRYENSTHLHC